VNYRPEISIVIPFHSTSVVETVRSIEHCDDISKCEIVLVGDGIAEGDITDVCASARMCCTLRVVAVPKCGIIGKLRNVGVLSAEAPRLYFIDSDCILESDVISRVLQQSDAAILKGRNRFLGRTWLSALDAQIRDQRYSAKPEFAYCPNLVVDRSVFDIVGMFDEALQYGSDGEFAKRLEESGYAVRYDPKIVVYHDVTAKVGRVVWKWTKLGEARYYRYRREEVEDWWATYFPNIYSLDRGLIYNVAATACNLGRGAGMLRAWMRK
jgi:hypothetical protein